MRALIQQMTVTSSQCLPGSWAIDKATSVSLSYWTVLTFPHPVDSISGESYATRAAAEKACVEHGVTF